MPTIRQAIKESACYVRIVHAGREWAVIGPNWSVDYAGPSTQRNYRTYRVAQIAASQWRARVVLAMMGKLDDESGCAIDYECSCNRVTAVRELVRAAMRQNTLRSKSPPPGGQ